MKKILCLGAEATPFAATGGLGDVLGSLPVALAERGADVRVMLPLYRAVGKEWRAQMRFAAELEVTLAWRCVRCTVRELEHRGVRYYFLDAPQYFERDGLYGHFDDGERFAFFCMAALTALTRIDFIPDVLHAHDWQAALAVVYLRTHFSAQTAYRGIRSVFTIHNIEYQGRFSQDILSDVFALDARERERMDFAGSINLMKAAILHADLVSTVSPRYAEEICTPAHGRGLEGFLFENRHKLRGILNGIDYAVYDPKGEGVAYPFDARSVSRKSENKLRLQRELGLEERADTPLIAVVSRLASHKGLDLVCEAAGALLGEGAQLAVLGCGERALEDFFRRLEAENRHRVCAYIAYDRALATRFYAGCDLFLMPSRSEPCGLSQMIASRFGGIPVVRGVGGLYDSIKPYAEREGEITGNGFVFYEDSPGALLEAMRAALAVWRDPPRRRALCKRIMRTDFSWARSARAYLDMYEEITAAGAANGR